MISMGHCLRPFFAGSIGLERLATGCGLRRGVRWILSINTRGGSDNKFFRPSLAAEFEHIESSRHIAFDIHPRVLHAGAYPCPGSQIDHPIEGLSLQFID